MSPSSDWIATANRAGFVTLYATGDLQQKWQQKVAGSFLTSACFSHDGSRLICAAPDGLTFLRTADGKALSQLRTEESIRHVLVMPNDRGIVTASRKDAVRFWPLADDALPSIWREETD